MAGWLQLGNCEAAWRVTCWAINMEVSKNAGVPPKSSKIRLIRPSTPFFETLPMAMVTWASCLSNQSINVLDGFYVFDPLDVAWMWPIQMIISGIFIIAMAGTWQGPGILWDTVENQGHITWYYMICAYHETLHWAISHSYVNLPEGTLSVDEVLIWLVLPNNTCPIGWGLWHNQYTTHT